MVKFGNFLYFLPLLILFSLTFLSIALSRRFGKKFSKCLILILVWANFALHFLKQFTPYYIKGLPDTLLESTATNFCAALIVMEPFILLSKNRYFKDYMFYVGTLSALAAYFIPTTPLKLELSSAENVIEVLRYYSCHAPLFICGILIVSEGHHKLDIRRLWVMPLLMGAVNAVILLNGLFFFLIGYPGYTQSWAEFTSRTGPLAGAAVFGPPPFVDKALGWLYPLTALTLGSFYDTSGNIHFIPSLWIVFPASILAFTVGIAMTYPFQKREIRMMIEARKQLRNMKRRAKSHG